MSNTNLSIKNTLAYLNTTNKRKKNIKTITPIQDLKHIAATFLPVDEMMKRRPDCKCVRIITKY